MPALAPCRPMIEQHRVVRCPVDACRSEAVGVRSSQVSAGMRLNKLHCRACGHVWNLVGGLGRILVVEDDGRQTRA